MAPPTSSILLKGGTLLLHDENEHVTPTVGDLLVEGQIISKIGTGLQPPNASTTVIECGGKIISPGFIDTHRHLYQTQYKGRHANHTLLEYLPRAPIAAALWSLGDLFWGQLAGALESIDAGTTTVAAIQALITAGLRAVYCYTPACRIRSTDPWRLENDLLSEDSLARYEALAQAAPYGNGTVHVGYAMDNLYLPAETLKPYYARLRDPARGKAHLITTHANGGVLFGNGPTAVQILASHDLLGPDILLVHPNAPRPGDAALFGRSGAHLSCTPNTELQMGTFPVALRPAFYGSASLGVDCHSWGAAGIPEQMRLLLQAARAERGANLAAGLKDGEDEPEGEGGEGGSGSGSLWSRHTGFSAESVFNLGTVGGARAAGLAGRVGRLREGLRADVVVFAAGDDSPSMLAAAEEDPVAAVVMHSSPRDVETVIVDGVVRKARGRLVDVEVAPVPVLGKQEREGEGEGGVDDDGVPAPGTRLAWADVAARLRASRRAILDREREMGLDFEAGEEYMLEYIHLNKAAMLEAQEGR
ncbi:hypothetical protein SLS62_007615 [Diatrype stigma]|uniref:Amidohydrolase-related domain-containing protein n=1 Tax=Diatrype stigma TaxID=117547 RepID=A0AAN9YN92_9PEZI